MCKNKKYQPNIMSAIDELQRCYRAMNEKYYKNELEDVVITVQSDPKRSAYAWISCGKLWNDKTENWYHEINIVAEYLNRKPEAVLASLLHEMAHLYNMKNNIQDTSRGTQYHNKKFKKTAEDHGLIIEKSEKYGWTITKPTQETIEWAKKNIRTGCFRMARRQVWMDGTPKTGGGEKDGKPIVTKKGGSNIIKYVCPKCGMIARTSKNADGKLMCVDCAEVMIRG